MMAGNKSNALANALLDAIFQLDGFAAPPDLYLALYTSDPTDFDVGEEVDGDGYERVDISDKFTTAASGRSIANDVLIEFPEAAADWGTVTHVGVRTGDGVDPGQGGSGDGDLLWHAALDVEKPLITGDQLRFKVGNLVFGYAGSGG